MSLPRRFSLRTYSAFAVATGILGGAAFLGATTFVSAPDTPLEAQNISSDDGPGDISGPCDEAEHANDPECFGVAGATGATSTTTVARATERTVASGAPSSESRSLDAAGAGTVVYNVNGTTLSLVSATPAAGWAVEVEQASGREIEVDFRAGTKRVQVNVEFEDGAVRERVRTRDDADGSETRIENGTVVRTEPSADDDARDDSSGPGSGDDNSGSSSGDDSLDDRDDDNSGSGDDSLDDRDDDNSGSGSGDDR